ncbi:MAG: HAMP domain-containing histidine kinase [Bacteroidales bacterium]|nr:HAMP domain-containing histidine kinase [Bacteroidales bacterium]
MNEAMNHKTAFIPLYLGISGHHDICNADKPQLKQMIKDIIEEKKVQYPDTPVIMLTPLAEGADRLAAFASLECGISFIAPLPMPVDEYRKDFTTSESLHEFNELLDKADSWFELPLPHGTRTEELQQNKEKRDEQYYQNGLFIARQSQLLIALWDGIDNEKQGGTAHIVKLRKTGLPSSHPQLQQRLQNLQSGPICHILTPRKDSPKPAGAFKKKLICSDYRGSDENALVEMDQQLLGHVDAYNRDVQMLAPKLKEKIRQSEENLVHDQSILTSSPELQRIAQYHAITDSLATHFKHKRFIALIILLVLAVVAFIFFLIQLEFWQKPVILLLYPLIMGLGTLWFLNSNRKRYRKKHDDYRALSEAFRIQYFLSIAQRRINVSEYYLQKYKSELEWRIYALRAAMLKCSTEGIKGAVNTVESNLSDCNYIKDYWVSDQHEYFRRSSLKYKHLHKMLRYSGNILFFASLGAALFLFFISLRADHILTFMNNHEDVAHSVLVVCSLGFLVVSGAVHGYNEKMAFSRQSRTFEQMCQLFRMAGEKLRIAIESDNRSEAVEIIRELAQESLMENLEAHQQELQVINTLLEEQKEELFRQREELKSTLENLHKTQQQLIESEKMAALGGLVAGVAHEINTPVGIGITAITTLMDDFEKIAGLFNRNEITREDFRKFLESTKDAGALIQKNLERTASLIQSFKQVSVDQVSEQQRIFVFRDYLNDILSSLQPKFSGKHIDFNIECDEKLELDSFPGVYAQIFTNFLLNSLQHGFADKEAGTIGIKADINKDLLEIQYRDDGAGISRKDLPHIFEPFYTSDQRKGTGLGLNIIYNLIKQKLHGNITCESEPGQGVLIKIEVPVNR